MKKVLFIAVLAILGLGKVNAQEAAFGVTGGFHNFTISLSEDNASASESYAGFFIGVFTDFIISDKFSIQPELQYAAVTVENETLDELIIPIAVKYYVAEKFYLQAGPQFDYIMEEDAEGINKFGVGFLIGAGFDFTDKLFATTRYSFGLTNRVEGTSSGLSSRFNTFQIGLGYRF